MPQELSNIIGCGLNPQAAFALASTCKAMKNFPLQEFRNLKNWLSSQNITDHVFSHEYQKTIILKLLNIIFNVDLSDEEKEIGKQRLTSYLKGLTYIDLSDNKIGAEGAKALAKALETNKSVIKINLGHKTILHITSVNRLDWLFQI